MDGLLLELFYFSGAFNTGATNQKDGCFPRLLTPQVGAATIMDDREGDLIGNIPFITPDLALFKTERQPLS